MILRRVQTFKFSFRKTKTLDCMQHLLLQITMKNKNPFNPMFANLLKK